MPANTYTWDASGTSPGNPTDGGGTWSSTTARWSNGSSDVVWPNSNTSTAVFGNHGTAGTVTVTTPVTVGGIVFNAASAGNYSIQGSSAITFSAKYSTISVAGSAAPTIEAPIAGNPFSLDLTGTGVLTLDGNSTYSGNTQVSSGTLVVASTTALGSSFLTVGFGATADINASTFLSGECISEGTVNIAAGQTVSASDFVTEYGSLTIAGSMVFNGGIFDSSGGTINGTVTLNGSGSVLFNDPLIGGKFNFTGASVSGNLNGSSSAASVPSAAVITAGATSGNTSLIVYLNTSYGSITITSAGGYNSSLVTLGLGLTNHGVITMAATGVPSSPASIGFLTNAADGTVNINTPTVANPVNLGVVNIAPGASLTCYDFNQAGGALNIGGTLNVTGANSFDVVGGIIHLTADPSSPGTLAVTGLVWPAAAVGSSLAISTAGSIPANEGRIDLLGTAAANFILLYPAGTLTVAANITDGGLLKTGPGTLLLSGNSTYAGATNISAGTVVLAAGASLATPSITLQSGAAFNVSGSAAAAVVGVSAGGILRFPAANAASPAVVQLQSLNLSTGSTTTVGAPATPAGRTLLVINNLVLAGQTNAWTSGLDLGSNDMDVTSGSIVTLTNRVRGGYYLPGGGNWNGYNAGIASSAAAADTRHLTAIGVVQNNQSGSPLFTSANPLDGYTPAAGDILLKYTWYGDANLDGKVDGSDYSLIDAGYASRGTQTGWYYGDFNYDGVIDGSDYTLIDNAFNNQGVNLNTDAIVAAATVQTAAVPEPAVMALAGIAFGGLIGRRRR